MSALNSPIDVAQLFAAENAVLYPDDPNGSYYADPTFYYEGPYTGPFSDFGPRIDGDSAAALDKLLRVLLRVKTFHIKVKYHGIEVTDDNGTYTTGASTPYTWEDDLNPLGRQTEGYASLASWRNAARAPGIIGQGGSYPGDGYTVLSLALLSNGAPDNAKFPLFLSFGLQCYPVVNNPYGGPSTIIYAEAVGDLDCPARQADTITFLGQTFSACSLGGVAGQSSASSDGVSKSTNFLFDSLEITDTAGWSWAGLFS